MKKILSISLVSFILSTSSIYADNDLDIDLFGSLDFIEESSEESICLVTEITNSSEDIKHSGIKNFNSQLYSYHSKEKEYIGEDRGKCLVLGEKINLLGSKITQTSKSLAKVDEAYRDRDASRFKSELFKLKIVLGSLKSSLLDYKGEKKRLKKLEDTSSNTITKKTDYVKVDEPEEVVVEKKQIKETISSLPTFYDVSSFSTKFEIDGEYYTLQPDSNSKVNYYLVDTKSDLETLVTSKGLENKLEFYLSKKKKYGVVNLDLNPLVPYSFLEDLIPLFGGYLDEATVLEDGVKSTIDLESLDQLVNSEILFNGESGLLGSGITSSYKFKSKEDIEAYFQPFLTSEDEDILSHFLVISLDDYYYVTRVKELLLEDIVDYDNILVADEADNLDYEELDSFKSEFYSNIKFKTEDKSGNSLVVETPAFHEGIEKIYIPYTGSSYQTGVDSFRNSYTGLMIGDEITFYYNSVDDLKELFKLKFKSLKTYKYYASYIENRKSDSGLFGEELSGNDEVIFETFKWIVNNIKYDHETKEAVAKITEGTITSSLSLKDNLSHYGVYTLDRKLGVCDGISILFKELLLLNGISSEIIVGKDNESGIGHALVKVGSTYYDPTNEISKVESLEENNLLPGSTAFYNMSENQLSTYFTIIESEEDEENFKKTSKSKVRENILPYIKEISISNPGFILFFLGPKDEALVYSSYLTNKSDWSEEFEDEESIYLTYFTLLSEKPRGESYYLFDGTKVESLYSSFLYAYLEGYLYVYYDSKYNQILFFKNR